MNPLLLVASALAVLLAAAHSYLGERYILVRLFKRENLPKLLGGVEFTKQTLRFAWHLTSIAWLGLAALIAVAGSAPAGAAPGRGRGIIAATFAASGLVALVGSRGRHLAWIVFLVIAGLVWRGWP